MIHRPISGQFFQTVYPPHDGDFSSWAWEPEMHLTEESILYTSDAQRDKLYAEVRR